MWTLEYILSQVCVLVAIAFFISTTYIKNRKVVIFLNCFVNIFYAIQYVLLKSYTGVLINAIGLIRCIWFYFDTKSTKRDYVSLIVCFALAIGGGIFTYKSWVDIIALVGSLALTYGLWQPNLMLYRFLAIANHICFIVYNTVHKSYIAVVFEAVVIILTAISIIKFHLESKKINKNNEKA